MRESQTCVGYIPHGVLESPDDGVQHQLKLGRRDGQEGGEALRGGRLQQVEEMSPVLGKLLKVLAGRKRGNAVAAAAAVCDVTPTLVTEGAHTPC